MAKRDVLGRVEGFYSMLQELDKIDEEEVEEQCLEVEEEDLGIGDVFKVERVVERRTKNGKKECLVLWDGYRREDASWVPEQQVTAAALRTFTEPNPGARVVLDAVSSLTTAFKNSLNLGTVRGCSFRVGVRRDVFNYIFSSCGSPAVNRRGKMFERADFNEHFFSDSDFVFCNRFDEESAVCIDFPVYMYSYVKFTRLGQGRVDFCETVVVTLTKKRC